MELSVFRDAAAPANLPIQSANGDGKLWRSEESRSKEPLNDGDSFRGEIDYRPLIGQMIKGCRRATLRVKVGSDALTSCGRRYFWIIEPLITATPEIGPSK